MVNNINCIFTLLIVKGTKLKLILATFFLCFILMPHKEVPCMVGIKAVKVSLLLPIAVFHSNLHTYLPVLITC